jgi:hypothetical protein
MRKVNRSNSVFLLKLFGQMTDSFKDYVKNTDKFQIILIIENKDKKRILLSVKS